MKKKIENQQNPSKKPNQSKASKGSGKKQIPFWVVIAGILIVLAGVWGGKTYYRDYQQQSKLTEAQKTGVYKGVSGKHRVLLSNSEYRFRETKSVMNPMAYRASKQIRAYSVAKKHPKVMDHIYCFCGCSKTIRHKSLLSCFTDNHGSMCGICQDQAIMAAEMAEDGKSMIEIVDAMDNNFS
ncbi:MAG: PCYCGC domain-containing protein [Deltaproteobacteria bacterium]|nr:PCYCGC domain-containing protein [Deltaproteobacteria bacterium]